MLSGRVWLLAIIACATLVTPAVAREVQFRAFVSGPDGLPPTCGTSGAESTPQLAAAPDDPDKLVGVYLDHGGEAAVGVRSSDGGRSWERIPVPAGSACTGGPPERDYLVNPYVAAGVGGDGWFGDSWAGTKGGLFRYGVLSHRLGAGGWDSAVALDAGRASQDAAVAADPDRPGIARFMWTRFDQVPNPLTYVSVTDKVMTATTTDGGRTFSAPAVADDPAPGELTDNPVVMQMGDGSFVAVVRRPLVTDLVPLFAGVVIGAAGGDDPPIDFRIDALRSTDGGAWERHKGIARGSLFWVDDPESDAIVGSLTDAASSPDGSVAFVDAPPLAGGKGTIVLTRSTDGGETWKPSQDTVQLSSQAAFPAVAVGPGGEIGLLWYDFRNDRAGDDAWTVDVWFASSVDDGRTWEETHLDGPMDLRHALPPGETYDGGAFGVQQDLVALEDGFGAIYSVSAPIAEEGLTDVRFARLG